MPLKILESFFRIRNKHTGKYVRHAPGMEYLTQDETISFAPDNHEDLEIVELHLVEVNVKPADELWKEIKKDPIRKKKVTG